MCDFGGEAHVTYIFHFFLKVWNTFPIEHVRIRWFSLFYFLFKDILDFEGMRVRLGQDLAYHVSCGIAWAHGVVLEVGH